MQNASSVVLVSGLVLALCATAAAEEPVSTAITYQGRLAEQGQPASGAFDLQFSLWDAATGGVQVGSTLCRDNVVVANGLFTVQLNFGPVYDGAARWLQIGVRPGGAGGDCNIGAYTTLTPRQALTAAPYALGVRLPLDESANLSTPAVSITNSGTGPAAFFESLNGASAVNVAGGTAALRLDANDNPASYLLLEDRQITQAKLNKFTSAGTSLIDVNPMPMDGTSNAAVRFFRETNSTGAKSVDFLRGTGVNSASASIAVNGGNSFFQLDGGNIGIGRADPAAKLDVLTDTALSGNNTARFYAPNIGPNASHIHYGVNGDWYIRSADAAGRVLIQDTGGTVSIGTTSSAAKVSIYAPTDRGLSVESGDNAGPVVNLTSGFNSNFGGNVLNIVTLGNSSSQAIYALQSGSGAVGAGDCAVFEIANPDSTAEAVEAVTNGSGDAVQAINTGTGRAGYFSITNAANNDPALYCRTSGGGLAFWADGRARVDILEITGADVAEKFPTSESAKIEPGTVMEIDPQQVGKLRIARGAYNTRVAGVVSGAGDIPVGAILGNLPGHDDAPAIALSGRVWVRCVAPDHAIEPGDLLTTSETAGCAMKAVDTSRASGATLGKAMSRLERGGTGLVLVLVNLQ